MDCTALHPGARSEAVLWLIDVAKAWALGADTAAAAVAVFDAFLSAVPCTPRAAAAVTGASLLVAAKALEDDRPTAADVADAVRVSVGDLLHMEGVLLRQLRYAVSPVTAAEVVAVMAPGVWEDDAFNCDQDVDDGNHDSKWMPAAGGEHPDEASDMDDDDYSVDGDGSGDSEGGAYAAEEALEEGEVTDDDVLDWTPATAKATVAVDPWAPPAAAATDTTTTAANGGMAITARGDTSRGSSPLPSWTSAVSPSPSWGSAAVPCGSPTSSSPSAVVADRDAAVRVTGALPVRATDVSMRQVKDSSCARGPLRASTSAAAIGTATAVAEVSSRARRDAEVAKAATAAAAVVEARRRRHSLSRVVQLLLDVSLLEAPPLPHPHPPSVVAAAALAGAEITVATTEGTLGGGGGVGGGKSDGASTVAAVAATFGLPPRVVAACTSVLLDGLERVFDGA
ncbi:hypothetical protein MMPV_004613 [Pyropia vietnamensis]